LPFSVEQDPSYGGLAMADLTRVQLAGRERRHRGRAAPHLNADEGLSSEQPAHGPGDQPLLMLPRQYRGERSPEPPDNRSRCRSVLLDPGIAAS